mmetsp:Transcript_60848/g.145021  ORF Transcript_60848/g.145021 Transcript_60848/m.145021 type:complete len:589 (+) Transcript_60848:119-1885(+)
MVKSVAVCFAAASLILSAHAMRHGPALEAALTSEVNDELAESCPEYCRSFNFVFMKTAGKSEAEVQKEVDKKCRFPMCSECAGGGGRPGVPCCTEHCELKDDGITLEEMAQDIGATVKEVGDSSGDELSDKDATMEWVFEPDEGLDIGVNPFLSSTSTSKNAGYEYKPTDPFSGTVIEPMTTTEASIYEPKPNEECKYLPGALWCPGVSYSPGYQYHKRFMEPLCCTEIEPPTTTITTTILQYVPKPNEECKYLPGALWCPGLSYSPGYKYHKRFMEPLCCTELPPDKTTTTTTPLELMGYKPKDDEECWHEPGQLGVPGTMWCHRPNYNVGYEYALRGMPLCCKKVNIGSSVDPAPLPAKGSIEVVTEYKAKRGEVCWHETGKLGVPGSRWCHRPSYNVGWQYAKDAAPLCCKAVPEDDIQEKDEDLESLADDFIKEFTVAPADLEDEIPKVRDPACPEDEAFTLKIIRLRRVTKTVCINSKGMPKDKICCSKKVSEVQKAMTTRDVAMEACSAVPEDHCSTSTSSFEAVRNSIYEGKVPEGFSCKKMFWCTDSKDGAEERVGPVESDHLCEQMHFDAKAICGAAAL